ncbi:MAG TPA: DNA polymerase III subunit alpha [Candidatus Acidoferrales bacterium]
MFVHLHCHSHYSFLRGVPSPEELIEAAARMEMPAVALTDTNGMYAAIPFYQRAREAGVKPILGTVLDIEFRPEVPGSSFETRNANAAAGVAEGTLVLLAANHEGYRNLCRLTTLRQLEDRPVTLEELNHHRAGLIVLGRRLRSASVLREIFAEAFYFEVWNHNDAPSRHRLRAAAKLAPQAGMRLAATNGVYFLAPEDFLYHKVLNAIRVGTLLSKITPPEITSAEAHFRSEADMRRAFLEFPDALRATMDIADQCDVELELGKLVFPRFELPPGETAFSYLWKLCFDGARERYRPLTPPVLARLERELKIIDRLNLAPYFLIVWDIVRHAREKGIPSVGRGSAASSIVAYCLGITRICPLRYGLYFERFLNDERGDCPDIDLDIEGLRRDDVLDYVYKKYSPAAVPDSGAASDGRVAMVSSFITMQARLAVREVAKVFGLSPQEVNPFTRRLPHRPVSEMLEAIRVLPECRSLPVDEEPYRTILQVALRLDNFPRHLGIHPCGTVITPTPLTDWTPLEVATKGIVVTQYDMNAIEALGLIKMDLLGQRGLTTLSFALRYIEENHGKKIDIDRLPEDDRLTWDMIGQGRTMGLFQIESPGMRQLLRNIGADSIDDVCLALALIRPGASEYGSKEAFLRRFRGREPVRYPHPKAEPILRETLGICIYQEQVLRLAQEIGALTLQEADLLRKPLHKVSAPRERAKLRAKFLKSAERMGIPLEQREEVWRAVEKFAGFGFCKAHAATYADISYRIAYLKAHYPAELLAAMCSSGAGFYHVSAYVEEAKRWGLKVLLPCIHQSQIEYTAESDGESAGGKGNKENLCLSHCLRIGLMQVKNLSAKTMQAILSARRERPFDSLEDFLRRVPVEYAEAEALIRCGAMDCFLSSAEPRGACLGAQQAILGLGETGVSGLGDRTSNRSSKPSSRPELLWLLNLIFKKAERSRTETEQELFGGMTRPLAEPDAVPRLPDYSREQRLAAEGEILEVFVSGHPLDLIARNGELWSTDLPKHAGRRVRALGWLITYRHVPTKTYRNMMFVTLEDQRGTFEVVMFPEAYERYGRWVFETRILRVTGRVEPDGQLNCEKLEAVQL